MFDGENRIIKNAQVLTEHFIPSRVLHRDGQLTAIRDNIKPLIENRAPRNMMLVGKPGTGKTCISRYVTDEFMSHTSSALSSYINCWECASRFKVLYAILQSLGMVLSVHRKGTPTDELLEKLRSKVKDTPFVVILDEADQLEDDKVLYDLISLPNTCIVLIANEPTLLYEIDPRIRSRLASLENIEFPAYRTNEILEILNDRKEWGLVPGAIKNKQLERISESSEGDARIAIDVLKIVAERAEREGLESIPDDYIEQALPRARISNREKNEERLNPHQKILLELIKAGGKIDSGTLYRELQAKAKEDGLEEIVDRTFRKYMDKLVRYRFVESSGTGRWRIYHIPKN